MAGIPAKAQATDRSFSSSSSSGSPAVVDAQRFNSPWGLALDEDNGVLYVADSGNHAVKRVSLLSGEVSVLVAQGSGLRYPVGLVRTTICPS